MSSRTRFFKECYVAFLDIMGFRNLVTRCEHDHELYGQLVAALLETKTHEQVFSQAQDTSSPHCGYWVSQAQAFSDCVLLFVPRESDLLSLLVTSICHFHDRLLQLSVAIRGAVTIGGMHWEDSWGFDAPTGAHTPIAFGPGLIEAYELESTAAKYPRILISNSLHDHIVNECDKAYPLGHGQLKRYCRQDDDGQYHLDLLHKSIYRKSENESAASHDDQKNESANRMDVRTPYEVFLNTVHGFILRQLDDTREEKVLSKYRWLARYYNDTVTRFRIGRRILTF